jgi:hypothetical protein
MLSARYEAAEGVSTHPIAEPFMCLSLSQELGQLGRTDPGQNLGHSRVVRQVSLPNSNLLSAEERRLKSAARRSLRNRPRRRAPGPNR